MNISATAEHAAIATVSPEMQATKPASILVADDHPILREGLVQIINRQRDMYAAAEAGTSEEIFTYLGQNRIDLILLDLSLGRIDGLELIKALIAQDNTLKILVLSMHDETTYAMRALGAGASGYIMKQSATDQLMNAIRFVLKGGAYLSATLKQAHGGHVRVRKSGVDALTDREIAIFQLIGEGRTTRDIATLLGLSVKTVETHRQNIKIKLALPTGDALICAAANWTSKLAARGAT